ncbi:hypothetical protein CWE08_10910 [Aliidiomarina iranensis]|uniref:Uncharacterized protein n=1 Tax=Aliidiomarina iranensis TaxID=1434071 RepID=A0A432VRD1_9GAMM|nr:hypothetical protein [Aliidiomarina iranensis]RUO18733.1 hypothetical protein CWE08_10910 [Aliidiomarina iranensis]
MSSVSYLHKLAFMPIKRRVLLAILTTVGVLICKFLYFEPKAQARITAHAQYQVLQQKLSTPVVILPLADKPQPPSLPAGVQLEEFNLESTSDGDIQYLGVSGEFPILYTWLKQFVDSQWYPHEASWQWYPEQLKVYLTLKNGSRAKVEAPMLAHSPFSPQETITVEAELPSCQERWPQQHTIVATLNNKVAIRNNEQISYYWQGEVHPESGLVITQITTAGVTLSAVAANQDSEEFVQGIAEASLSEAQSNCLAITLPVSLGEREPPRWLP